jgi:hypothetical protein
MCRGEEEEVYLLGNLAGSTLDATAAEASRKRVLVLVASCPHGHNVFVIIWA